MFEFNESNRSETQTNQHGFGETSRERCRIFFKHELGPFGEHERFCHRKTNVSRPVKVVSHISVSLRPSSCNFLRRETTLACWCHPWGGPGTAFHSGKFAVIVISNVRSTYEKKVVYNINKFSRKKNKWYAKKWVIQYTEIARVSRLPNRWRQCVF